MSSLVALRGRLGSGLLGLVGDLNNDVEAPLDTGEDPASISDVVSR